ncbi:MFS transporter [Rhizobiaceae bacterium BDR2-2]|uniref:MFS transporter n=1 Tax=Ectorhizobium quercum TaxID=2965071 RepID=A0AAE3MZ77_9HYPH|nr:MFS transporter [Ectorhizobium quercum]MCX8997654.1 MFS transporter [Ectorhizobium quercum]
MAALAPSALLFFCNSILFISLFTRMPAIQAGLGIDKAILGLTLLGMPVGTFLALPVAGRIVEWLTPRGAAALMLALLAFIEPLFPIMPLHGFAACFVAFAFLRTILDVSANMIVSQTERVTGRHVMARSHGFWSVGLLVGSVLSGWLAGFGFTPAVHLGFVGAAIFAAAGVVLLIAPRPDDAARSVSARRRSIVVLPSRAILLICVMIFGMAISEGAIYDWGMFLIRERIAPDPTVAGLLYACFTIGMGGTRLVGDHLRGRFSAPAIVRGSALAAALGIAWLVHAGSYAGAAVALVLTGCGMALITPLAFSTALALPGRSQADNLTALAMCMLIATLGVPPLLGMVGEHAGIQWAFLILLPFIVLTFAMAPVVAGRSIRLS